MRQKDRERFYLAAGAEQLGEDAARRILRAGATLKRLAEAVCNGDWPADNGSRHVRECPRCKGAWAPSVVLKRGCPECRAEDRVNALLDEANARQYPGRDWRGEGLPRWTAETRGDPRGAVLLIKAPSGRELVAG